MRIVQVDKIGQIVLGMMIHDDSTVVSPDNVKNEFDNISMRDGFEGTEYKKIQVLCFSKSTRRYGIAPSPCPINFHLPALSSQQRSKVHVHQALAVAQGPGRSRQIQKFQRNPHDTRFWA